MAFIGNTPISVAFLTDTFSGNGSTTAFTMTVAPANTSSIIVAITGVLQDPSTYSVSGTTLTFSAAPPTGTSNISVRYLGIPASGVTTTAYRTVTDFTATAGQTSFSVPSYTIGYIDVYRNGVRLVSTDYTATTGTTVVLNNACTVGDAVVTESFYVSSVLNAIPATAGAVNSTYLASSLALTTPTLTSPTISSPTISGTPVMGASVITSGTAVASTSGTSIDFTSIPSWVKRITVMFDAVSLNGSSNLRFQLGDSGGVETTGYVSVFSYNGASNNGSTSSTGFDNTGAGSASLAVSGQIVISLLSASTNTWTVMGLYGAAGSAFTLLTTGSKSLSGTLDRIRITTVNGTDTFDAGSINILYE
jgi:hypothetical protein